MKLKCFNVALPALALLLVGISSAQAGIEVKLREPSLAGSWTGTDAVITINDHGAGIIVVHGIDNASSFECSGVQTVRVVTCAGSGMQHELNKIFTYSAHYELHPDGSLSEAWEAMLEHEGKAVPRNGKMIYQRGLHLAPASTGEGTR